MNILWLASWYPSRVNFLAGDFIERHAKAAALFDNIVVIHVVKDSSITNGRVHLDKIEYSKTLTALIWYYPAKKKWGRFIENIVSAFYYLHLHFRAYSIYKKKYCKPEGILVQVAIKAGIVAYIWKLAFGDPYIVFERWTGLLKKAKPNFNQLNFFYRWFWKVVLKNSGQLITVTNDFGRSVTTLIDRKSYVVIPNMIDDQLFYPVAKQSMEVFRLIHVSTLDYQKNFEDILHAIRLVVDKGKKLHMTVYGPVTKELNNLTIQLMLENIIDYKGEVTHPKIAKAMQQSHALVLYSRYESFGNVVIEANACGLPVIVSDLPVFHEIVKEGITGIFVQSEMPAKLAEKIMWLMEYYNEFDPETIHNYVKHQYNSAVIGNKFHELFSSCFERIKK
jgi:glycosyltransferase involved in cell wall biosynthesis